MAGAVDFVAPRPLAVTVGNYLLMYADGRFTRHPRFRYFALNTEMHWRAVREMDGAQKSARVGSVVVAV